MGFILLRSQACSSAVEILTSIYEALGLIPGSREKKKGTKENASSIQDPTGTADSPFSGIARVPIFEKCHLETRDVAQCPRNSTIGRTFELHVTDLGYISSTSGLPKRYQE